MDRKRIIWIVVAVFVLFVGFRMVTSKRKGKIIETDTAKPVYVQKAGYGSINSAVKISGNIVPSLQADIYSRVPGKLIRNLVEDGDYVKDGQDIALIDRDEVGVSFSTATARSTINGMLLKHYLEPGTKVNPMMPVATVGNIKKVKAVLNPPESDFTKIKRGTRALVSVEAYPGRKFAGEVTMVSPEIDAVSRSGKIEIMIDNPDQDLRPGMFGLAEVLLASHSGVIVIPRSAIIEDGDIMKAYVVDSGKAREKILKIGIFDDDNSEVLGGLKAGEELIVEGQHKLKDGDLIRIVEK